MSRCINTGSSLRLLFVVLLLLHLCTENLLAAKPGQRARKRAAEAAFAQKTIAQMRAATRAEIAEAKNALAAADAQLPVYQSQIDRTYREIIEGKNPGLVSLRAQQNLTKAKRMYAAASAAIAAGEERLRQLGVKKP